MALQHYVIGRILTHTCFFLHIIDPLSTINSEESYLVYRAPQRVPIDIGKFNRVVEIKPNFSIHGKNKMKISWWNPTFLVCLYFALRGLRVDFHNFSTALKISYNSMFKNRWEKQNTVTHMNSQLFQYFESCFLKYNNQQTNISLNNG